MSVVVITPPAAPVVSLAEAKKHLRAEDFTDDDAYIESLVAAATGTLDGPAGWLGRALVTQTLEWRGDYFGCYDIELPYPPIASVSSVKYDDTNGTEQTVSSSDYRLVGQPNKPRVALAYGASWPSTRAQDDAIRIRYVAGYGAASAVPAPIKHAILLMVGELYEKREAAADAQHYELPFAVTRLLSTFRPLSPWS